ncbi:hypothetical protein Tco_1567395, partial [Tanacetum coccineum]
NEDTYAVVHLYQVDLVRISKETQGYVNADLATLCTKLPLDALEKRWTSLNEHFQTAVGSSNSFALCALVVVAQILIGTFG